MYVEYNGASTRTAQASVAPSAPAFFHAYGFTQGAILNVDGSVNSAANPAASGSIVSIFGTGGGPTNPSGITGGLTPMSLLAPLTLPITVTIDGNILANVQFSGAAPTLSSGVFQINFEVPAGATSGSHTVDVKVGGSASDPHMSVTLAVQ